MLIYFIWFLENELFLVKYYEFLFHMKKILQTLVRKRFIVKRNLWKKLSFNISSFHQKISLNFFFFHSIFAPNCTITKRLDRKKRNESFSFEIFWQEMAEKYSNEKAERHHTFWGLWKHLDMDDLFFNFKILQYSDNKVFLINCF